MSIIIHRNRLKILNIIFKEDTEITGVDIIRCSCNVVFIVISLLKATSTLSTLNVMAFTVKLG